MGKTVKTSTLIFDEELLAVKEVLEKDGHDISMSEANKARHEIGKEHERSVDNLYLKQGISTHKRKFIFSDGIAIPDGFWELPTGKKYWFESTTCLKNPATLLSKKRDIEMEYKDIQFVLNYNPTQKKQVNVTKALKRFKNEGWVVNCGVPEIKKYAKRISKSGNLVTTETLRRATVVYVDWRKIEYHPSNRINKDSVVRDIVKSILDGRTVGGFFSSIIVVPETVKGKPTGRYICVDGHTRLKAIKIVFEEFGVRFSAETLPNGIDVGEYDIPTTVVDWITSEDTDAMNDLLKKINTTIKKWDIYDFVRNGAIGYEKGTERQITFNNYLKTYKFSNDLGIGGKSALPEMVGDKDPHNGWLNREGLKHGNVKPLTGKEYDTRIVPFGNEIAKPLHTFLQENLNHVDSGSYRNIGKFLFESIPATDSMKYAKTFLEFLMTSVDLVEIPRNKTEVAPFISKIRSKMIANKLITKKLDSKVPNPF